MKGATFHFQDLVQLMQPEILNADAGDRILIE